MKVIPKLRVLMSQAMPALELIGGAMFVASVLFMTVVVIAIFG